MVRSRASGKNGGQDMDVSQAINSRLSIMRRMAAFSALLAFGVVVPSAAAHSRTYLPSECGNQVQRPSFIRIACGDGSTGMEKLVWHAWGASIAQGVGFAYVNDCEPSCSVGGIHYTPAEIYVSRIRKCRGRRQYTYAAVIVSEGKAARLTGAYKFPCASRVPAVERVQPGP
jgi:hypothetical protein